MGQIFWLMRFELAMIPYLAAPIGFHARSHFIIFHPTCHEDVMRFLARLRNWEVRQLLLGLPWFTAVLVEVFDFHRFSVLEA